MVIPKSKPVAFDVACLFCRRVVGTTPLDEDDSSWWSNEKRDALRCSNSGCDEFGDLVSDVRFTPEDLGARWGHEWAAVAWMATSLASHVNTPRGIIGMALGLVVQVDASGYNPKAILWRGPLCTIHN